MPAHKPKPPLKDIHRARVILAYTEKGTRVHSDGIGWAQIDGPWVLWLDDEFEHWQSWPIQSVVTVEWIPNGQ